MLSEFLIVFALILGNGLFAGAEIALLTIRKTRVQELVDRGSSGALAVKALRDKPERFLATVQIGITVISATSAVYGGEVMSGHIAAGLRRVGFGGYSEEVAFAAVVAVISYLSLVVGELVPKSLALRQAERYAVFMARPLLLIAQVMRPLVWFLTASSNIVLRLFGDRTSFTEARLSREELQELVEEAAKTGSLDAPSSEIAARAIGFGDVRVGELMVPRSEMVALPRKAPAAEVQRVLLEEGHARMPVFDESMDGYRIVGYIVAKDILALTWQTELIILEDILRPVHFVKLSAKAADVMRELQRRRMQLAIVLDEQEQVAGLITMEDLVEELVGEIFSEDERERIRRQPDGTVLIQGSVPVREVNRELDLALPEGEAWTTLAGLAAAQASAIPRPGWKTVLPDGTLLEVVDASPRKVELLRVTPRPRS